MPKKYAQTCLIQLFRDMPHDNKPISNTEEVCFMIGKRILALAVVLLLLLGIPMVVQAETDSGTHKSAYIILVDKLSVHDISESSTPAISRLIEKGALGLASSRTLR